VVIRYCRAPDVEASIAEIVGCIGLVHVDLSRVVALRSHGSKAAGTIARIHGLPRIWQISLGIKPNYVIELISERFDRLSQEEREKVLIHELLHIPKGFGGGFRQHRNWVENERVQHLYRVFKKRQLLLQR